MFHSQGARPRGPRQQTLAAAVAMEGVGLHTGCSARLRLLPAPENAGVSFVTPQGVIPASGSFRVAGSRCTALAVDGAGVQTIEHLLAALYGCGIDNARVELEGPEVPIGDGSARPFVEA